jgi:hypothetical protein
MFHNLRVDVLVAWCGLRRPFTLAALQGLGASASISMFVSCPIAVQVIGPVAGVALALCMLVENLLEIPAALALADSAANPGGARLGRTSVTPLQSVAVTQ